MNRNYDNGVSNDAMFFIGTEIEHTPAHGIETLFIVGVHSVEEIKGKLKQYPEIKHIFFGANHSFDPIEIDECNSWEDMICHYLTEGYICSLDIPISAAESFHEFAMCEYDNFIPQLRVPVPYIKLWNYNTMIKIDDKDFNATNPGVWAHSLHKLMDRECFTDWKDYSLDKVIK